MFDSSRPPSRRVNARDRLRVARIALPLIAAVPLCAYLLYPIVADAAGERHEGRGRRAVSDQPPRLHAPPEIQVPRGMVYVPGGRTRIGSDDGDLDERPVFRVHIEPFFMDRSPVTVAQFRTFVDETGYRTDAERLGDAGLFDASRREWRLVRGAHWRYPLGPEGLPAADDHPVTQVSWNDAVAFATWAGKRLPTEIEWEHAARGARDRPDRYAWGDHLDEGGRYRANTWNGRFPIHDSGADGYPVGTSPVGAFGETELGLTDMGGNVWEWTADWYRAYGERTRPYVPTASSEKAQRGGSYLCHADFCHGFRVSARSRSTPETALAHVGFRTVQDL
jgi:formylglycine-generating enzyme